MKNVRGDDTSEVKRDKGIDIEELKALVKNLIPTTLKQAEWICSIVERLTHQHPELKRKVEEWGAEQLPESERRKLEEVANYILAKAREDEDDESLVRRLRRHR